MTVGAKRRQVLIRGLVELVDIYPTLGELAGLPAPANLEGQSFARLLDTPHRAWESATFSQCLRTTTGMMGRSMRTGRYRLMSWTDVKKPGKRPVVELYDLRIDPVEAG